MRINTFYPLVLFLVAAGVGGFYMVRNAGTIDLQAVSKGVIDGAMGTSSPSSSVMPKAPTPTGTRIPAPVPSSALTPIPTPAKTQTPIPTPILTSSNSPLPSVVLSPTPRQAEYEDREDD